MGWTPLTRPHSFDCACVVCRRQLPYPPPSWIPDDAPAKKKYTRALARYRLHLLVEWVEIKREVALVCRLWWAWFGGVWSGKTEEHG